MTGLNKASILWSHHEETRELRGERDKARNNARCTQAMKTTHGLDGQHQDVDRTLRGRVSQNDRDKWRKYVHGSRTAEEQNRAEQKVALNPVTCLALLYSEFFNPINALFKGHWK